MEVGELITKERFGQAFAHGHPRTASSGHDPERQLPSGRKAEKDEKHLSRRPDHQPPLRLLERQVPRPNPDNCDPVGRTSDKSLARIPARVRQDLQRLLPTSPGQLANDLPRRPGHRCEGPPPTARVWASRFPRLWSRGRLHRDRHPDPPPPQLFALRKRNKARAEPPRKYRPRKKPCWWKEKPRLFLLFSIDRRVRGCRRHWCGECPAGPALPLPLRHAKRKEMRFALPAGTPPLKYCRGRVRHLFYPSSRMPRHQSLLPSAAEPVHRRSARPLR